MRTVLHWLGRLGDLLLGGPAPVPMAARLDPYVTPHSRLSALTTQPPGGRVTVSPSRPSPRGVGPARHRRTSSP